MTSVAASKGTTAKITMMPQDIQNQRLKPMPIRGLPWADAFARTVLTRCQGRTAPRSATRL